MTNKRAKAEKQLLIKDENWFVIEVKFEKGIIDNTGL